MGRLSKGNQAFHEMITVGLKRGLRISVIIQAMIGCLSRNYGEQWVAASIRIFGPDNYLAQRSHLVDLFYQTLASGRGHLIEYPWQRPFTPEVYWELDTITFNYLKIHYFNSELETFRGSPPVDYPDEGPVKAPSEVSKITDYKIPSTLALVIYHEGKTYVVEEDIKLNSKEGLRKAIFTSGIMLLGLGVNHAIATSWTMKETTRPMGWDNYYVFPYDTPEYLAIMKELLTDPHRVKTAKEVLEMTDSYLSGTKVPPRIPEIVPSRYRMAKKKKRVTIAPDTRSPIGILRLRSPRRPS